MSVSATVTDAEWAVALVREVSAALFGPRHTRIDRGGDAPANPSPRYDIERGGRESPRVQPAVR